MSRNGVRLGYSPAEWQVLKRLTTPEKIQHFIDEDIAYNKEPRGPTCRSPRMVLRDRQAHCMEGALVAAAALEIHGYPPLLVDLEAVRDDDHVLAVFRSQEGWGAIAKSNYSGLRFRTPIYRTIRELALSYFEHYYNPRGEKTLRAFSRPVNLRRFDYMGWRTAEEDVWDIPNYLVDILHFPLLPGWATRQRFQMDNRLLQAGMVGMVR